MTLRRFLLIPLLISVVIFSYFSANVHASFTTLSQTLHLSIGLLNVVAVAVLLQIGGHIIRSYKAKLIFGVAKESSTRFQFRALSLGYLFNTLLPFRLGELIRARIISGAMSISFGYAFVLVIFERLVDAVILGIIGLVVLSFEPAAVNSHLTDYIVILLSIGVIGIATYIVLAKQNTVLLRIWYRLTALLNETLKVSLRFKAWTIIYGLQQTLRWKLMLRYMLLSLASWLLYIVSLLDLSAFVLKHISIGDRIITAAAPYYGTSVPAGPGSLGAFSRVTNRFLEQIHITVTSRLVFDLIAWGILVIPIAMIGLVLLFTKTRETLWYKKQPHASKGSLVNKLHRSEDISMEMSVFLENYFSGNKLSHIVHNMELTEDFKLVKYFKGGSDAITILALQNNQQIVKKIIPHEFEDRLKAQHDWLVKKSQKPGIVKVLAERRSADFYAIDLEYDESNEMFYEYIHRNPIASSEKILDEVYAILFKNVYGKRKRLAVHELQRDKYIQRHIFDCLDIAAGIDSELIRAAEPETLLINGRQYDNLYQIIDKIKHHPQAWLDIATYEETTDVHGDVIVDNLLVSKRTSRPLIIDPAPDGNIIQGPVFDFGKAMQSLYCGYETLLRDEDAVYLSNGNSIDYRDLSSDKYSKLANYVRQELAPRYLSESEQRAMLFHAATLHIRRLKHQVYYTPANVLKFYAVGVKTLNEYLAQYDQLNTK